MKKQMIIVFTAVALSLASYAELVQTHLWDFTGADQEEMLSDKAGGYRGDAPLSITGTGINLNGDGIASFAGFKKANGDAASYAVADIANIDKGVSNIVSLWYKADPAIQYDYCGVVSSNTSVNDGAIWQIDFLDRDSDGDKDLRFISETAVGAKTVALDPAADQWHHVAVIQRTGPNPQAQIWFDNAPLVQNDNWTGNVVRLVLGANRSKDVGFAGQLANVQVWELEAGDANSEFPEVAAIVDQLNSEGPLPDPRRAVNLYPLKDAINVSASDLNDNGLTWNILDDSTVTGSMLYIAEGSEPNFVNITPEGPIAGSGTINYAPAFTFENDKVYSWRVDTLVTDSNAIEGSTWMFDTSTVAVVTAQPSHLIVDPGQPDDITISVDSVSTPTYQWYKTADSASDTPADDIAVGVDANSLAISGEPADEGYYFCVVSNNSGIPVVSNVARVAVKRMISYWKFDGDYTDELGSFDLDPNDPAGALFVATGQAGQALSVNDKSYGVGDASFRPTRYSNQLTVSAWIRIKGQLHTGDGNGIVIKGTAAAKNADNWVWGFYARKNESGKPTVRLLSWNGGSAWSAPLPMYEWVHVAATVGSGRFSAIYVNGVRSGTTDSWFGYGNDVDGPVMVGSYGEAGFRFPGDIDDVRVYNYGMDKFGIADLYHEYTGKSVCINNYDNIFDITGPEGVADCKVDLFDLAEFTADWLACGLYPDCQ